MHKYCAKEIHVYRYNSWVLTSTFDFFLYLHEHPQTHAIPIDS